MDTFKSQSEKRSQSASVYLQEFARVCANVHLCPTVDCVHASGRPYVNYPQFSPCCKPPNLKMDLLELSALLVLA